MNGILPSSMLIASVLALLSGCTVFPTPEPPRVMDFSVPNPTFRAEETRPYSFRVDTPYASYPMSSNRILAKPTPWEFQVYDGVRWRDTVPVIVRDLLVKTIRASGGFENVISDTNPADADWTLVSELSAFHTENNPETVIAVIALHGQVINNRSRATLCSDSFRIEQPAEGPDIEAVVEAFSLAGERLSQTITEWAARCNGVGNQEAGNRSDQAALR
ncbi:ABC-type transport auxiliary lipoprotein family protein [Marinobacter arenosus]|uniref:ABC-type transport auxiliary lipoprotein family protein n=1 Tax=Marinobacter arenosus TaxID=2856822 RepID=UPI001C4D0597|nr:ABC-type transport auxiliary lipoprotein family protein [Marinobacter arenosus]MBW0146099.1 membrane integrity-associated transporter subunit PqiC [Marinobacter arenosus]